MRKMPLVSIIMPAYNCEKYIEYSIKSVLSQTYTEWELLIVDDKSSDSTVDIIRKFSLVYPKIKTILNERNNGAAYSRNIAIDHAQGDYISFLDADDLWYPDKLHTQITYMLEKNVYFSYTYYDLIDVNNDREKYVVSPNKINYKKMLKGNSIGCLTVTVSSNILKKCKINDNIMKRNDYALWLKCLKYTDGECIPVVLSSYRTFSGSVSSGKKLSLLRFHYYLFRKSENMGLLKSFSYTIFNAFYYFYKQSHTIKIKEKE